MVVVPRMLVTQVVGDMPVGNGGNVPVGMRGVLDGRPGVRGPLGALKGGTVPEGNG
ncbi:uncharacterized protein MYCFIDRAFT_181132 [Pseudocercospora fijiensis CIRAD86]|uniref:Uncharacterized protein n=1 Tax=Pseudocercospora fijiensis (strain CIRAD86) TaxID=383855 RepID=N1Q6K8_PSEFD|nr:uncharacterized protein MYCFIDRAFT_181132 [Pseudocercospora fijiensis CIRAD86]EME88054.1 hypothetical protein MYCFIDRAFT_181132 [Pseudocercospora fijiensis CIRAD86]